MVCALFKRDSENIKKILYIRRKYLMFVIKIFEVLIDQFNTNQTKFKKYCKKTRIERNLN